MIQTIAIIYAVFILCVIAFQCCLIAGAPWGHLTQGGQQAGKLNASARLLALLSIFLLLFMAAGITSAARLPPDLPLGAGWLALGFQLLVTVMNWITRSPLERQLWGPITTIMLGLASVVVFAAYFSTDR